MAPQDIVEMYEITITTKYDQILVFSEFTKKISLFLRILLASRRGRIPVIKVYYQHFESTVTSIVVDS